MRVILAVAISAAAYYISIGLGEFWPAAWIAPIPILLVAFRSSAGTAALAAFAAYFLGSLNVFTYLAMVMPAPVVIAALGSTALVYAAAVLIARFMVHRLPAWAATIAFPLAWTVYEFIFSLVSPHGTALSLAYSQMDFLPVIQIASITGIFGITFVVALVPSAIAVAWWRGSAKSLLPAALVVLVVFGYGLMRLSTEPRGPEIRVGLTATDQGVGTAFQTDNPATALAVAHAYAARIARAAADGAQVVILPEKFVGVTAADENAVHQVLAQSARAAHVTVIAGFNRISPQPPRNIAAVFGPDGRLLLEYDKHHMLPGPETGYRVGGSPGRFSGPGTSWGVAICKDMDFPGWSRRYGQEGVRLLAVPAWDFVRDARLHSRMAVLRGVEGGFTIARTAQQGSLTFSDAYGRILAETPSSAVPDAILVHNIPAGPGPTPYTRMGNWFGWLSVIGLSAGIVCCVVNDFL